MSKYNVEMFPFLFEGEYIQWNLYKAGTSLKLTIVEERLKVCP